MAEDQASSEQQDLTASLARALPRLTAEQIAQVSPRFDRVTYAPGEVIIHQDDPPRCFYLVVRGRAEVVHRDAHGHDHAVDVREPGSTFGEIGLLKDRPRTATVRATADEEVELLALGREDFLALVDDSRATETQVTQDLSRRMITLAHHQE
jgi:ATP-binding cassette subfamily B protein